MAKKKKHFSHKGKKSGPVETKINLPKTPVSFLDVLFENFSPMKYWAAMDLSEMIEEGEKGPVGFLKETPTRYRSMIGSLSNVSLPEEWPKAPYHPGKNGERSLSMSERLFLTRFPFADEFYRSILSLNLSGNRVYNLSDSFVQRMLATKLDMPNERIRLPYPAIAITAGNETMTRAFLGAARQHEYRSNMGLAIYAALHEKEGERILEVITIRMEGRKPAETLIARIHFPDGMRTGESISAYLKDRKSVHPILPESETEHLQDWFSNNASGYYRTLLNCILYLTIPNAHVGPIYKPTRNGSDLRATRVIADTQDVGKDMKPLFIRPGEMFEKERFAVKAPGTGRKLDHMVLVSGHYRDLPRQQHLPERERREIWIEPYIKGPDGTEEVNKPYVVL